MISIEICGEHGPEVIQIETGNDNDNDNPISDPTCAHCSYCLAGAPVMSDVAAVFKSEIPNLVLIEAAYPLTQNVILHASKPYCSQCRGPPNGSTYNKMISAHYVKSPNASMMLNISVVAL